VRRLLAWHRQSHLPTALALKACQQGYRVLFATAQEWVSRLEQAQDRNQLEQELRRLERYHLLVVYLGRHRDYADMRRAAIANGLLAAGFFDRFAGGIVGIVTVLRGRRGRRPLACSGRAGRRTV
jgi:hypothetical protein